MAVIVVCYKMEGQIGNTIRSLLPPYQKKVRKREYDIILVDNGSPRPLPEEIWKQGSNVRYLFIPPGEASPNPGVAINRAVRMSQGEHLGIMIDGARMVTPGVLHWGRRLLDIEPGGMVEVLGWHLGPKFQSESILEGYTQEVEKEMLLRSQWWENGYRLFEICAPSEQTRKGFASRAQESNCFFIPRKIFDKIGGYNEGYKEPGGGLVNLDFYERAVGAASQVFTLLGEGTFHQVHGGAATSLTTAQLAEALARWSGESQQIRGAELSKVDYRKFIVAGHLPPECRRWMNPESSSHRQTTPRMPVE
ncbi:MAG TPA: glycosyltransferase [Chthoniobacteraceae bacterium]|nr:glycosyltransferase [Chthoniobacteraceae bacterium]